MNNSYAVIIPAYNEVKYLPEILKKFNKLKKQNDENISIIVVDDGSCDDTGILASKEADYVLSHPVNLGKGAAMKTGAEFAFNQLHVKGVVFMDADAQHNPIDLTHFIEALKQNYPLVYGVRQLNQKMQLYRQWTNHLTSVVIKNLFGKYIPDILCGYKAMSKAAYQLVRWESSGYSVELEIVVRGINNNLAFTTIPIATQYYDLNKGMTLIDALRIIPRVFLLKLTL